jgi:hypothetical protein
MKKLLILLLVVLPFLGVAQNPFEFVGQSKADIEKIIGKPVARDYSKTIDGQKTEQFAYPFTAFGGYHIGFVNDTAKVFIYTPKVAPDFTPSVFNFSQFFPSVQFALAEKQSDATRKLYRAVVNQNGRERTVLVDCFLTSEKVAKVTFL